MTEPARGRSRERLGVVLLVCAGVIAVLIRVLFLAEFPAVQADEGLWTTSTKNKVVFGDWFMDRRTHMILSPVFHAFSWIAFELAGPSVAAARVVSGIAGVLTVVGIGWLALRLSGSTRIAVSSALLFGINEWTAFVDRTAMIEAVQLLPMVFCLLAATYTGNGAAAISGVLFGLTLATKVNGAFLAPIAVLALARTGLPDPDRSPGWRSASTRVATFGLVAGLTAGLIYGGLYLEYPAEFVTAFKFEAAANRFGSNALIRIGRFGIDPVLIGRSAISLLRESPLLIVLGIFGAFVAFATKAPGRAVYGAWGLVGTAFIWAQVFQPIRYYYLLAPAVCFFAAAALIRLAGDVGSERRRWADLVPLLAVYCTFEFAYLGMNGMVNRDERLKPVTTWFEKNTGADSRVLLASYLATDLPRRAYGHYHYAETPAELIDAVDSLGIDFIVVDEEWRPDVRRTVDSLYTRVQSWPFGAVYATPSCDRQSAACGGSPSP